MKNKNSFYRFMDGVIAQKFFGDQMGDYSYDRLGRRAVKTVGEVDTRFVYDPFGNVICEYQNDEWTRDYVYGAGGEVLYMEVLDEAPMNEAYLNFFAFVDAWLCSPYCTQADLTWDVNADSQINLIDWSASVAAFEGAFAFYSTIPTTGRYLLTDFRNSVVAKITPNRDADAIDYTAFGEPIVNQGTNLEGLSILWNGYYYDYETGNYYLRNRYYSPVERRFLTEDPHGVNPDGNWNNPFGIDRQYRDGYGLQVYAQGDPVNNRDDWGLWKYALPTAQRTKEEKTFVEASGVWEMKNDIRGLAQLVRLDEEEFDKWGKRATHKVNGINKCGAWVPNTVLAHWGGVFGGIGKTWVWWSRDVNFLRSRGYLVKNEKDWTVSRFENYLDAQTASKYLYGLFFWGHGGEDGLLLKDRGDQRIYYTEYRNWPLHYKLGFGFLYACYSNNARYQFSTDASFFGSEGVLIPIGTPPVKNNY